MKIAQAVKLACEAIDAECQRLAVNANLHEHCGMESGKPAWEKRKRLREAKAALLALVKQPRQLMLEDSKAGVTSANESRAYGNDDVTVR